MTFALLLALALAGGCTRAADGGRGRGTRTGTGWQPTGINPSLRRTSDMRGPNAYGE